MPSPAEFEAFEAWFKARSEADIAALDALPVAEPVRELAAPLARKAPLIQSLGQLGRRDGRRP